MTNRETIEKLEKGGKKYEKAEMSEVMNESFKLEFSVEEKFVEPREEVRRVGLQEVKMEKHENGKLLEKLDVRKAMGPVEVSN